MPQGEGVLDILQVSEEVQREHVGGFVYGGFARRAYAGHKQQQHSTQSRAFAKPAS